MTVPPGVGAAQRSTVSRRSPDQVVSQLGRRIEAIRRARGLTQVEAANALGMDPKNWQRMVSGQNVTVYTLARVAIVLDVEAAELLSDVTSRRAPS